MDVTYALMPYGPIRKNIYSVDYWDGSHYSIQMKL